MGQAAICEEQEIERLCVTLVSAKIANVDKSRPSEMGGLFCFWSQDARNDTQLCKARA